MRYKRTCYKIMLAIVLMFQMLGIIGCTTVSHEPSCHCDCMETNSHFECGGIHNYEDVDIK